MARISLVDDATTEELTAIDNIADMAFWQLMLIDDLNRATGLVELLVERLRGQVDEIRVSSAGFVFDDQGELVEASR